MQGSIVVDVLSHDKLLKDQAAKCIKVRWQLALLSGSPGALVAFICHTLTILTLFEGITN